MLRIILNGQTRIFDSLEEGETLAKLIAELGLKSDRVAVERNSEIVARSTWSEVRVHGEDRLEVVHFVGGGRELGGEGLNGSGIGKAELPSLLRGTNRPAGAERR